MLSAALLLFANTLLFSLRLSGGGSFPKPLSAAEEREYLRRYAQGDQEARDVLIERNLRLVAHIIKKYYTQSADQEDLISIGTIGLIKGISSFDPEKGARLATYAARCIENEILMYFRSQKKLQGEVSLSDSIETDKEGNALQLMDVVGVDDTMLDDIHDRDSALRLHQIIRERLTTREAEIIRLVRAGRHHPPDPEGNCRLLRDFPVLCVPHRKAGAGKAAPGAAGRPCAPAGPAEAPFLRDVTAGFGKQRA